MTCFHYVYGLIKTPNDVKSFDNEYLIGRNYSKLPVVAPIKLCKTLAHNRLAGRQSAASITVA